MYDNTTQLSPHGFIRSIFRGQVNTWPLASFYKDRNQSISNVTQVVEIELEIRDRILFYVNKNCLESKLLMANKIEKWPFYQEWHFYFHIQHLGFPTRLMDWTQCENVAKFFATHDSAGKNDLADGIIYKTSYNEDKIDVNSIMAKSPYESDYSGFLWSNDFLDEEYAKRPSSQNIQRQQGIFFLQTPEEILKPFNASSGMFGFQIECKLNTIVAKNHERSLPYFNEFKEGLYVVPDDIQNIVNIVKKEIYQKYAFLLPN